TAREKEISRIEAEIEAARKRREAAAGTQPVAVPVVNTRPVVVQAPSGNSGVTPVTDTRGLGVLEAQSGPAKAAVGTPVLTAEVGAPSAPANPAGPTLTPEAEA